MRRLTILHTIETGGPGGAETVVRDIAANLARDRFRSVALLPEGTWLPHRLRELDVPTVTCSSTSWRDPTLFRKMIELVRNERVDVIHSHLPDQNFYASVVGTVTRRPVIVTYHGAVEIEGSTGLKGALKLWYAARFAHSVVAVCDQMARYLAEHRFPARKIVRIYNGVDVRRFRDADPQAVRAELGLDADVPLVGVIANIRAPKGHEHLIRAAAQVVRRFPRVRFLAAGEHQAGLSERLRDLVAELGLSAHFTFLGFRPDVRNILAALDVLAIPSTNEGFPLIALEAMSARKPVVATRCGGVDEIIRDGETGYLVPVGDPAALAERICAIFESRSAANAMAQAGAARVEKLFSHEAMISQYERLYAGVAGIATA